MLANGTGKGRGTKTGGIQAIAALRLLYLSAGEISLNQHMLGAGQRAKAGQDIRLLDIPADAGKSLGIFDTTHDTATGAAFSRLLVNNCTEFHGRVGSEYLTMLCAELDDSARPDMLSFSVKQLAASMLPVDASGQVSRAANKFALVGVAGELATRFRLTGWQIGESEEAAKVCFNAWVDSRGGAGNQEVNAIISQVRSFFQLHGESRFTPISRTDERITYNRAGFSEEIQCAGGGMATIYYCLSEAYTSEICKGFDPRQVKKVLIEAGWLQAAGDGKSARQKQLPGMGNTRCYFITPRG
jgi:putative DNA primase/helicase